tara:strand:+ start:73 stop:501 length:429 start_codon:yes stop_codon:yes gene_type:complete
MRNLKLTTQEKNIVNYHRQTIKDKKVGVDEQGRPITVYAVGLSILDNDGNETGKFVSVPGYVEDENGNMIVPKYSDGTVNEDYLRNYWKSEINTNFFPIYNSGEELNKRSEEIHEIMNNEKDIANKSLKRNQRNLLKSMEEM